MEYLTVKDIAERLRINRNLVVNEIRAGKLPAVMFGRRGGYRIEEKDFNEWLEKKKTENRK